MVDGNARPGHFLKKRSKDLKKVASPVSTTDDTIPMSEQEHNDMLMVAKVERMLFASPARVLIPLRLECNKLVRCSLDASPLRLREKKGKA